MLQTAPLLLGYTLSSYLYFVDQNLASFVVGFVTFVPLLIASAATLSCDYPSQSFSRLSFVFRLTGISYQEEKQSGPKSGGTMVWAGAAHSIGISHM